MDTEKSSLDVQEIDQATKTQNPERIEESEGAVKVRMRTAFEISRRFDNLMAKHGNKNYCSLCGGTCSNSSH